MAKKGQKFRKHNDEFKEFIVALRLKKGYGINKLCKMYGLSPENVIKWTRRFLNGEPLTMKRGRSGKRKAPSQKSSKSAASLEDQIEQLKAELAYKDKVIEYLEERERLKKKKNSESSKN